MANLRLVGSSLPIEISEGGSIAPCRVVTTTNITVAGGAPNTYSGVALADNDRILVAGQTIATENGIYRISAIGTGADGTWVRAADANLSEQFKAGMPIWVSEGSPNVKSLWYLSTNDPVTLGVTNLSFIKYQSFQYKSINADYNLDALDSEIGVDTSGGVPITITLPLATTVTAGRLFCVNDITGNAGANNVILSANPANTINGGLSFTMNTNRSSTVFYSDGGTAWFVRSGYNIDGVGIFQPLDAGLTSISALVTAADTMIYTTALDAYTTTPLTAAGRAILDDASAADQRTTLGLGTIATQNANAVAITGGSVTGITDLAVADGGTGLSAGTDGGVLGFTAAGTIASSVLLTANALVLGGGAGATPTPMGSLGTTTTVLHGNAAGAPTFGAVVPGDADLTQNWTFTGALSAQGGFRLNLTETAVSYLALATDVIIGVTDTSAARTISLPPAATAATDRLYIIKDQSGGASVNNITVDPDGAETIDGAATAVINTNYGSLSIYTNGSAWFIW